MGNRPFQGFLQAVFQGSTSGDAAGVQVILLAIGFAQQVAGLQMFQTFGGQTLGQSRGDLAVGIQANMGGHQYFGVRLIFGLLVIWMNTNQYATGLALSLFGAGFSAFAGIKYVQEKLPERPHFSLPVLGDIPVIGPALFRQHPMVYVAILLVAWLVWFLYRSRAGLVLRSVGESPRPLNVSMRGSVTGSWSSGTGTSPSFSQ